jgi:hypothetical protein
MYAKLQHSLVTDGKGHLCVQQRVCAIKVFFRRHEMSNLLVVQPCSQKERENLFSQLALPRPRKNVEPLPISRLVKSYVAHSVRDFRELFQSMLTTVLAYFLKSPQTMCNTSAEVWEIYRCLADDAVATRATLD